MFKRVPHQNNFTQAIGAAWWMFMVPGLAFLGFGILILLMPQILVAMISSAFILLGVVLISLAWKARRATKEFYVQRDDFPPDIF